MTEHSKIEKARYATDAKVTKYVTLAKSLGLDVAWFEVSPDGSIRVGEARAPDAGPVSDFDKFKDQL
jgi:hypothetical protein